MRRATFLMFVVCALLVTGAALAHGSPETATDDQINAIFGNNIDAVSVDGNTLTATIDETTRASIVSAPKMNLTANVSSKPDLMVSYDFNPMICADGKVNGPADNMSAVTKPASFKSSEFDNVTDRLGPEIQLIL